ncbi:class I SAM-dependent methyltransferase [Streptomyces sp. NPDC059943]|uniref:class I SAM-dependent methyltransferase n=1 Tax=unclassified Streptomyces TaxID=2593676 RepID=UPI003659C304
MNSGQAGIGEEGDEDVREAEFWAWVNRGSRDRIRAEVLDPAILAAIGPVEGRTVLDAGSGEGELARAIARRGARVTAVDRSPAMVRSAAREATEQGLSMHCALADIERLPLRPESVDVVVARDVLNDLADPRGALSECSRVLAPGGRMIALVLHPCFSRPRTGLGPAESYFDMQEVETGSKVAGVMAPKRRRISCWPLGSLIEHFVTSGFFIAGMTEPRPTSAQRNSDPWWQDKLTYPYHLIIDAISKADGGHQEPVVDTSRSTGSNP